MNGCCCTSGTAVRVGYIFISPLKAWQVHQVGRRTRSCYSNIPGSISITSPAFLPLRGRGILVGRLVIGLLAPYTDLAMQIGQVPRPAKTLRQWTSLSSYQSVKVSPRRTSNNETLGLMNTFLRLPHRKSPSVVLSGVEKEMISSSLRLCSSVIAL